MEIRARISLAVEQFKAGIKSVTDGYGQAARAAAAADQIISKTSKQSQDLRRVHAEQSSKAQIGEIRKVEQAAIESNKNIQKAYQGSTKLPLPLVQQSIRGTVTPSSRTEGLPERKTAEYRYEVEMKIAALRQKADDAARKSAEINSRIAQREAEYKARGFKAGKPVGMEENVLNLLGKDPAKAYAKTIASMERDAAKVEAIREKNHQRELARIEKEAAAQAKKAAKEAAAAQRASFKSYELDVVQIAKNLNNPEFERSLAAVRYALYDIGQRFIVAGQAMIGFGAIAVTTFAKFESAFTSVERTSGLDNTNGKLSELRESLLEISRIIPVAFQDVSAIATLGAQMGIAAEALDSFSITVAQFSAITGISVEQAAMGFGRLSQMLDVPTSKFENLSSAITFAGVNSVATDTEILRMAESIGVAANQAGFSADQVIGLSAALASLKVRPEEARGVITRLFREFSKEAELGTVRMGDFAKIVGVGVDEAKALLQQDPSQFFTRFLKGAKATGTLDLAITQLGITNTRELRVIQSLANNIGVLESSMVDANEQFLLGEYSAEAYGKVADDLQSKLTILNNQLAELGANFGEGIAIAIKPIIDLLNGFLNVANKIPKPILAFIAAFTVAIGSFLVFKGVMALTIAGLLAMKLAVEKLGIAGLGAGINMKTLVAAMINVNTAMMGTAASTGILGNAMQFLGFQIKGATFAMKAFMVATGALAAVAIVATISDFMQSAKGAKEEFLQLGDSALEAAGGFNEFIAAIAKDQAIFEQTGEKLGDMNIKMDEAILKAARQKETALSLARGIKDLSDSVKDGTKSLGEMPSAQDAAASSQEKVNESVQEGTRLIEEQTLALGRNAAAFLIEAATKYTDGGEQKNFFIEQLESPDTTAVAEALGFDLAQAVTDGMKKEGGSQEYIKQLEAQMTQLAVTYSNVNLESGPEAAVEAVAQKMRELGKTEPEINAVTKALTQQGSIVLQLPGFYTNWAKSNDATIYATKMQASATENLKQTLEKTKSEILDEGEGLEILSEALKKVIEETTKVEQANQRVAKSFGDFAKGAKGTKGEIEGLTSAATENMSNWTSFLQATLEATTADGTGVIGMSEQISAALVIMGEKGLDTGQQFNTFRDILINAFAASGGAYATLGAQLATAPDLSGMISIIDTAIRVATATAVMTTEGIKYVQSLYALRDALSGGNSLDGFRKKWSEAMTEISGSSERSKTAIEKLRDAISSFFSSVKDRIAVQDAFANLGKSIQENGKSFSYYSESGRANLNSLISVIESMSKTAKSPKELANNLAALKKSLMDAGITSGYAMSLIDKAMKRTGKSGKATKKAIQEITKALKQLANERQAMLDLADAVDEMASRIKRFIDIKFGESNALLAIEAGWQSMAEAANKADSAIQDAQATIAELSASKGTLEYQLQIALKYGDTLRANEIRAELSKIDADIAEQNRRIAEAQQEAAQDDPASRQQRAQELQNMTGLYADLFAELAASGKYTMPELEQKAKDLAEQFKKQALELGFSEEEASKYATTLETELLAALNELPPEIKSKIDINTKEAKTAMTSLRVFANQEIGKIKKKIDINVNYTTSGGYWAPNGSGGVKWVAAAAGGLITGPGTSTSDSIPARLSDGEFVVRASAVKHYGVDFMNALNNMRFTSGMNPISVPQSTQQSSGVVYLSPEDRSLLRAFVNRPVELHSENAKIASSADKGNIILAQRGSN